MPSFSLDTPVCVQPCSPGFGSWCTATSDMSVLLLMVLVVITGIVVTTGIVVIVVIVRRIRIGRRLESESVDPEEQQEHADDREPEVEDDAVADQRQRG